MKKKITLLACIAIALGILSLLLALNRADAKNEAAFQKELQRFAESTVPIITWLEAERTRTGTYPNELPKRYHELLTEFAMPTDYSTRDGAHLRSCTTIPVTLRHG